MDSNPTYKITELVGTSTTSIDDAVRSALTRAASTLRHLDWFEVATIRGYIGDSGEPQFQVVIKVGFRLEG